MSEAGGAESGALNPQNSPETAELPADLARVVDAWPELPSAIRAGIMAMVDAAGLKRGKL